MWGSEPLALGVGYDPTIQNLICMLDQQSSALNLLCQPNIFGSFMSLYYLNTFLCCCQVITANAKLIFAYITPRHCQLVCVATPAKFLLPSVTSQSCTAEYSWQQSSLDSLGLSYTLYRSPLTIIAIIICPLYYIYLPNEHSPI